MAQINFDEFEVPEADPYASAPPYSSGGSVNKLSQPHIDPYTTHADEYNWFTSAVRPQVQSVPSLYGKVGTKEIDDAFQIFNELRPTLPNRGDAYNQTLDRMGWWTGTPTYHAPASSQTQQPRSTGGPQGGNYQQWFNSLIAGKPANSQSLLSLESDLGQYGIKVLRNAQGIAGKIQLPDGSIVDVGGKFSSGDPGRMKWQWLTGSGGRTIGNSHTAGVSGQMFDDPATKMFQDQILDRLDALMKGVNRPDDDRYRAAALARADELTKQPPYTAAEEQALITRMREPLTQARDTRQDMMKEIMGGRNIGPSSGLFLDQVYNTPERDYERALAGGTNDLAVRAIDERQDRKDQAMSILSNLVGLGRDTRNEDEGRAREVLTTGAILPELSERRLQLLMQTLGMGSGDTSSLMGTLTNLMQMNQNQSNFNAGQSQNNAATWGSLLGYLVNSPLFK
jgi:hypothetical protein